MNQLSAATPAISTDFSKVMEEPESSLGQSFQQLVGKIVTAVANATAISYGINVNTAGPDVLSTLPDAVRNSVETQQRQIAKKLVTHWNNPLCSELEFALQKRVSKEECRHLAFFPSEKQMESYVLLVQDPPDGAPTEHPQRKLRQIFLSLLYLVHIENWKLVKHFVAAGGLMALVPHIAHDSLGIRSQAIDVIHRITSSQYFNWFLVPKDHESKVLHQRFLQLSQTPFVQNLLLNAPGLKNKKTLETEPASMGSFLSLQILAFWLSWVRKLYSNKGELRLSREILGSLQRWSQVASTHVTNPDEIELAKKVFEDFNRLPPADGVEGHHVELSEDNENIQGAKALHAKESGVGVGEGEEEKGGGGEAKRGGERKAETNEQKNAAQTTKTTQAKTKKKRKLTSKQIADRAKKMGNESFVLKNYEQAMAHYTTAIAADATRSVLYANRAACHLSLSKSSKRKDNATTSATSRGSTAATTMAAHATAVVEDCEEAIRLHPTYVKAFFRRAQGYLLLEQFRKALDDVDQAVVWAKKELLGKPPKERTLELKKAMRAMNDWKLKTLNKRDAAVRKSKGWSTTPGATLITSTLLGPPAAPSTTPTGKPTVDGIVKASKLGLGIVDALLKREKWDIQTGGGDRSAPVSKLEPDVPVPAEDGGSGTGSATDAGSFVNATANSSSSTSASSSSASTNGSIPLKKKSKKKKKKKNIETTTTATVGAAMGKKKIKMSASSAKETKSCTIKGLGTVEPPRTATGVERVINHAMKTNSSGVLLLEYYTLTFPPVKFRKVLKENINENILLSMIAVAVQLAKKANHEALEQHLKGIARVRRLDSALMFLDDGPKKTLKNVIEDMIGEESEVQAIKDAFGGLKW